MKNRELAALLLAGDPEAEVCINLDGSIFSTLSLEETEEYNQGNNTGEFFILASEEAP